MPNENFFTNNLVGRSTFYVENPTDDFEYIVTYQENDLRENFNQIAETLKYFCVKIILSTFQKMHFSLFRTFAPVSAHVQHKKEIVHKTFRHS